MGHNLSDFNRSVRMNELSDELKSKQFGRSDIDAVNTHLHTFYSFNIEGLSPLEVLYRAKDSDLKVAGVVDFDVLDAMDEAFEVGDLLKLKTVVSLETRAFVDAYKDREINSPGETGVLYCMGVGFTRLPEKGTCAFDVLQGMRSGARERNLALLGRLEDTLAPLVIDYAADVESLTPAGNATERHIVEALEVKSKKEFSGDALVEYWSERLGVEAVEMAEMLEDSNALRNTIRAKLMKRGSVGYVAPDSSTFPPLATVIKMVEEMKAVPCWAWLDGMSTGEKDAEELVAYMVSAGIRAIAIIPERNWNFADPDVKAAKVAALKSLVEAGRKHNMIFAVGTEMNSFGQPFVDDFAAEELAPFVADFVDGAYAAYGHTIMERAAEKGLMSEWAKEMFGNDYKAANEFYTEVGKVSGDPAEAVSRLEALESYGELESIINALK